MKISMSEITTLPAPLVEDLPAFAAAGFDAVEIQIAKVERYLEEHTIGALVDLLAKLDLKPTGAIGLAPTGPALLLSNGAQLDSYLSGLRRELEICRDLGIDNIGIGADAARWMTHPTWQKSAVDNLRRAGRMAADHGLRIGVEFMSLGAPIGPFVLDTLVATRELVGEAGDPAVGVNVDFFHHFRGGGTVEELAALGTDEIVGVHVTDVRDLPKNELGDGDRMLPGDGVIPLADYRQAILSTGYQGYWTLELLNEELWKNPLVETARIGLAAMRKFEALNHIPAT
jgi:2-keto-myo-inositol isomerase